MSLRAIEFYSGIGGLHRALLASGIDGTVVRAFDRDKTACDVYALNVGPDVVHRTDIATLTPDSLADLRADLWLLSPSCQPFTVLNPRQKGMDDPRSKSFFHLFSSLLPALATLNRLPLYILLENVAGFQVSDGCQWLLSILSDAQFTVHQFLLSPSQLGIPNSRLRYYLLAKLRPKPIRHFLDPDLESHAYSVPDHVLQRWGKVFDIVLPSSTMSCCFTRGYTHLIQGSGSILQQNEALDTAKSFSLFEATGNLELLHDLRLRYFTPAELLRLLQLQPTAETDTTNSDCFKWPPSLSDKAKYRLIGNSINVSVVSALIRYLVDDM